MNTMSIPRVGPEAILEGLRWRYATKNFDIKQTVSDEDLEAILEAIRLAPTSMGLQPFHVTVVADTRVKADLHEAAYQQAQVMSASHVLVFSAKPNVREHAEKLWAAARKNGAPEENIATMRKYYMIGRLRAALTFSRQSWAARQAYIPLGFAIMTAAQLGIDACPMEGFSSRKVARILGLPGELCPVALLAIGYRSPTDNVRPKYRLPMHELISRDTQASK
jgi:nitroreductase